MALKNETCILNAQTEEAIAAILGSDKYFGAEGGSIVNVLVSCYKAEGQYYEAAEYEEFSVAHDVAGGDWLEAKVDLCLLLALASASEQGFTTIFEEAASKVPAQ